MVWISLLPLFLGLVAFGTTVRMAPAVKREMEAAWGQSGGLVERLAWIDRTFVTRPAEQVARAFQTLGTAVSTTFRIAFRLAILAAAALAILSLIQFGLWIL